ncbi:hypothetical protein Acr_00g0031450 [Actinidia rufa]|uniref:Retroviral polymerase SH3-like domain-containing protein n=1 Tax=Actinidia rufa TaxID=165716 RepID=A0A7J0DH24_9ERIC|nr:hypothetical protein Acr_00g0031450 [Actinidia rufa]
MVVVAVEAKAKALLGLIAQLQSHLGLAPASPSSGPTATIVAKTPTALHGKSGYPTWILNSGANNHMTGELATFTSSVTSVNQSNCIADGSSIPIRSQGPDFEEDFWHGTPSRVLQGKAPLYILQLDNILFSIILRVFECTCFVQNRSQTRTKLDDNVVRCIFLGYSSMSKGYSCYDPVIRHMYHSLDVMFLETVPTPSPGTDSEILAVDNPIPPRLLPILEPPPPTPNGSLPLIVSPNPSPRSQARLPTSSPESSISPPLVSYIPPPRYPTCSLSPLLFSSFQ